MRSTACGSIALSSCNRVPRSVPARRAASSSSCGSKPRSRSCGDTGWLAPGCTQLSTCWPSPWPRSLVSRPPRPPSTLPLSRPPRPAFGAARLPIRMTAGLARRGLGRAAAEQAAQQSAEPPAKPAACEFAATGRLRRGPGIAVLHQLVDQQRHRRQLHAIRQAAAEATTRSAGEKVAHPARLSMSCPGASTRCRANECGVFQCGAIQLAHGCVTDRTYTMFRHRASKGSDARLRHLLSPPQHPAGRGAMRRCRSFCCASRSCCRSRFSPGPPSASIARRCRMPNRAADRTIAVLHEHAARVLETNELVLSEVMRQSEGRPWDEITRDSRLWTYLLRVAADLGQPTDITLADGTGRVRMTTTRFPAARDDSLAGQEDFEALRGRQGWTHVGVMAANRPDAAADHPQPPARRRRWGVRRHRPHRPAGQPVQHLLGALRAERPLRGHPGPQRWAARRPLARDDTAGMGVDRRHLLRSALTQRDGPFRRPLGHRWRRPGQRLHPGARLSAAPGLFGGKDGGAGRLGDRVTLLGLYTVLAAAALLGMALMTVRQYREQRQDSGRWREMAERLAAESERGGNRPRRRCAGRRLWRRSGSSPPASRTTSTTCCRQSAAGCSCWRRGCRRARARCWMPACRRWTAAPSWCGS